MIPEGYKICMYNVQKFTLSFAYVKSKVGNVCSIYVMSIKQCPLKKESCKIKKKCVVSSSTTVNVSGCVFRTFNENILNHTPLIK